MTVKDVDAAGFDAAVVARSHEVPVVVDFWAEWCGPCKTLGPVIEAAVEAREGAVELVKVDTDANQQLAQRFNIRGIPAVKAFVDGEVVEEFTGALNRAMVDAFLDKVVPRESSEVEAAVAEAVGEVGDLEELMAAAQADPTDDAKLLAYGRALAANGHHDEALETLLYTVELKGEHMDAVREQLLELFAALGDSDPRVPDARKRLGRALF